MSDNEIRDTPPDWVIAMVSDADRMRGWTDGQLRAIVLCAATESGSQCWWADPEAWRV